MIRKLLTLVSFAVMALFVSAGLASADTNYVPAPVTTSVVSTSPVATTPSGIAGSLSYTGAGFNVGGAVLIAAIVLLIGVGLVVGGAKMSRRRSAEH